MTAFVVPRGAEEAAVRRGAPGARIVAIGAGASAASVAGMAAGDAAIVIGLCGALRAHRVGATVIYRDVVDDAGRVAIDPAHVEALRVRLPDAAIVSAVTTGHVVTRAAERAVLAARFGADVVDMEGTHLARALTARGVAFMMVRVVSDDATADLPPIEDAIGADGTLRPLRLAGAFAREPVAAARFVRDVQRALAALRAIAAALTASA